MTFVPANRAGFVTPAACGNLLRDLGARLTGAGADAGHMLSRDAPAGAGPILRGAPT